MFNRRRWLRLQLLLFFNVLLSARGFTFLATAASRTAQVRHNELACRLKHLSLAIGGRWSAAESRCAEWTRHSTHTVHLLSIEVPRLLIVLLTRREVHR